MLRKLCGQTLVRCKDLLEENLDVFSDDTDPVHALSGNTATVALHVTGIDCPSCALLLRGTIKTVIHGITSSSVDFAYAVEVSCVGQACMGESLHEWEKPYMYGRQTLFESATQHALGNVFSCPPGGSDRL